MKIEIDREHLLKLLDAPIGVLRSMMPNTNSEREAKDRYLAENHTKGSLLLELLSEFEVNDCRG